MLNKLGLFGLGSSASQAGRSHHTETQRMFLRWNADRLGITINESQQRFAKSWESFPGGHAGKAFRDFNDTAYKLYQVFHNDTASEVFEAYQLHAPMHFLRMLGYSEPEWSDTNLLVQKLASRSQVDILDFGCGLAQRSRTLAACLKRKGVDVRLHLADIPTLRKDFLIWLGKETQIPTTFLSCTRENPIPTLPPCDFWLAMDFFEHVYEPLAYFEKLHTALKPNGLMMADVVDHEDEFMHVSPRLGALRDKIRDLGYKELVPGELFEKV
jgi:2-polyprenyl-3-methyl-5-hydroxy-6-metoxy-1,4-benzoquinol methylase